MICHKQRFKHANSEGQTDTNKMEDLRQNNVEHKRNAGQSGADNEEKTQTGQNEMDDVHKRRDEELSHHTGGEEGEAESVKNGLDTGVGYETEVDVEGKSQCGSNKSHNEDHISVSERKHEMGENHGRMCEVKSSGDEGENLSVNEDGTQSGIIQENTKEMKEDDASLNLGEKIDFCRVDEEKKTDKNNQKVTLTQSRHYGLHNQGATCYLNSVLQVLSMTTEIHNRLNTTKETDFHLINIFEDLKEATCRTETITAAFGIQDVHEQRDAAECLEMILREISPQASEVFQGALTYTTTCSKDHKIIEETNEFWTLPLSLKDAHDSSYSVERSFEMIFKSKSFNGGNMVYCNDCDRKTEAESCEMVVSPPILTLLLKRFDFDYNTMTHFKSHRCVDVPRELQRNDKKYELYAMVNHFGSLTGGHYTATIRSNEDNTWYEFNDTHVSKVEEQPFAETNSYNSRTVYLLMYREAAQRLQSRFNPGNWSLRSENSTRPGQRAHWPK
ncbi:ubl carboxyl-terminal hydrolase 18-like isoform 3-T3 [Lycodopsis pacificus]